MPDLSLSAFCLVGLLAMIVIYAPLIAALLLYERAQLRLPRRHHDHLIPATPRSARR